MQKQLILAVMAMSYAPLTFAQSDSTNVGEAAFTFTEAQLGEGENMGQNVSIVSSSSNVYASEVGYLFSPMRFRYRALNQKYNEMYINGTPVNDMETGQFRYSLVGGLNQQTRNMETALPFESNNFSYQASPDRTTTTSVRLLWLPASVSHSRQPTATMYSVACTPIIVV